MYEKGKPTQYYLSTKSSLTQYEHVSARSRPSGKCIEIHGKKIAMSLGADTIQLHGDGPVGMCKNLDVEQDSGSEWAG